MSVKVGSANAEKWLEDLGLSKYKTILFAEGYDDIKFFRDCESDEEASVAKMCGMPTAHARQLRRGIARLKADSHVSDVDSYTQALDTWLPEAQSAAATQQRDQPKSSASTDVSASPIPSPGFGSAALQPTVPGTTDARPHAFRREAPPESSPPPRAAEGLIFNMADSDVDTSDVEASEGRSVSSAPAFRGDLTRPRALGPGSAP